jgi:hypothetical protein
VLLLCAALLGLTQRIVGEPSRAWPELAVLAVSAFVPIALATRIVAMPGAASAVAGAYLLPRALLSLVDPSTPPPPLLLVPAVACDLAAWLRPSDFTALRKVWPRSDRSWPARRDRSPRRLSPPRAALAGAKFALTLAAVEPPFALLLGANPAAWLTSDVASAALAASVACAAIGLALSRLGRGTES